ncbi:MAG: oligosaccharide flippase family protein [Candidatus Zixiibacteriota bacterium]
MHESVKNNQPLLIDSILKNTGKDALRYVPGKLVRGIINFTALLIYTRIFTAEDYGNFYLTIAAITILSILGARWLVESVNRFYAQSKLKSDLDRFYSTIFYSYVLSTIVVLLLVAGGILILRGKISDQLLPFLSIGITVYIADSIYGILLYTLRASLQAKSFSVYEILFATGKLALSLLIVFLFKMGAISLLYSIFLVQITLVIFLFKKFSLHRRIRWQLVSKQQIKEFFRFGSPLIISSLSMWLLLLCDRYMLNFFRNPAEVGIYSVSYAVVDRSVALLYTILMLAAYPIIIFTWEEKGKEITQKLIKDLSRYFFMICIPACLGISVLSKDIFSVLIGKTFEESYKLVPFFAFCSFCAGWFQYIGKGFEIYKKTMLMALVIFISGISNLVLNLFLIPQFGFIGAGIAKSVSYVILIGLGIKLSHSLIAWSLDSITLIRVSFSGLAMTLALFIAKDLLPTSLISLIVLLALGAGFYIVLLLLSKEIKKGEVELVRSYSHRLFKAVKL